MTLLLSHDMPVWLIILILVGGFTIGGLPNSLIVWAMLFDWLFSRGERDEK